MGNPLDMFGGGGNEGGGLTRRQVPLTNAQRHENFLQNFYNSFGGGGSVGTEFGNPHYRDTVSAYFNTPFDQVGERLSQVNMFRPRQRNFQTVRKPSSSNNDMFGMSMPPDLMGRMPKFPPSRMSPFGLF